jgi:hypothetical protein
MNSSENQANPGWDWGSIWFRGAIGISIFFIFTTLIAPLNNAVFKHFDIGVESNLAALWSGILLFLTALHAFDGFAAHRATAPSVARAWLIIAMVMAALSLDEVGSFHERVPTFGGHSQWLTLLPIALFFGSMLTYALFVLARSPQFRTNALLIALGFLLFGTVAIQEHIQNSTDWTGYVFRIRTVIEEGTELLGMILILKATMGNTKGMLGKPPGVPFPVFEVIGDLRTIILFGGFFGAIILAYLSLFLTSHTNFSQSGQPTAWLTSALFFLTALNVLRPVLTDGREVGWQGWAMAGLAGLACASTPLSAGSPVTLPLMMFFSVVACGLWILDPRYSARNYVPAMAFFAVIFLGAWLLRGNDFVAYCLVQFVALAFFYVGTARVATEAPPAALPHQVPGE